MSGKSGLSATAFIVLYVILLGVFFAASFFTEIRLWGLSSWGYFPLWGRFLLLGIGLAFIPLALRAGREDSVAKSLRKGTVILTVIGAAAAAGVCFWVFRGQTHFLGDGYLNVGMLSGREPMVGYRDFGEMQAHLWLAYLLGGNTKENVLLSYQILSVMAGILFTVMISWTAWKLFQRTLDAALFGLSVLLSGYVLLFFGYVENYSLFVLAVGCFTGVGLLAAQGKVSRWTVLIPLAFALVFHIFGVTFIIPAAYLLLSGGKLERRISNSSPAAKMVMVLASGFVVTAVLWIATDYSLFLRIALLSLTDTRFTVEGYTLFSVHHLEDCVNLLLLLIPGLPLLLIGVWNSPLKKMSAGTDYRFLIILAVTALIPAFIFDPKLGMPRDWDLFSYAAVPMSVLLAYTLLDSRRRIKSGRAVLTLAVALTVTAGIARVSTQFAPSMALRQIKDYIELDKVKTKGACVILQTYYAGVRDRAEFDRWGQRFMSFPDERLIMKVDTLLEQNRLTEALASLKLAVQLNPMSPAPYKNISAIYMLQGKEAAARAAIDTALGLGPGNPAALVGKGFFLQRDGKPAEAEKAYLRSIEMAPQKSLAWFYLARLRLTTGDSAQYIQYLDTASTREDAAPEVNLELCNAYVSQGRYQQAAEAFRKGIEKGLSRQAVDDMVRRHPELQRYLRP